MTQSTGTTKFAIPKPKDRLGRVGLLQRGSELAEFESVLEGLGIPFDRFGSELPRIEDLQDTRVILASTERLLESGPPHLSNWPRTIAIIQDPSKTLSAHLGRIGVSMILCRPIHPHALRLLLLHEVYRGPEKRVRGRTLIGQPIRLKAGLFRTKGTILDLSSTGARVQMNGTPKIGAKMRLTLGGELNGGKPLKLSTQVVRTAASATTGKGKVSEVGLAILDARSHQKAIATILQHFKFGPGRWSDLANGAGAPGEATGDLSNGVPCEDAANGSPDTDAAAASAADAPATGAADGEGQPAGDAPIRTLPPSVQRTAAPDARNGISVTRAVRPAPSEAAPPPAEPEAETHLSLDAELDAELSDEEAAERRGTLRVPYDRRVVALGEAAARVLVGQDLSTGGMRVLSRDGLAVGDQLQVALHCGTMMEPVVVSARAIREHGEEGMILSFDDLSPEQSEHLEKIVTSSGPIRYMTEDEKSDQTKDSEGPAVIGELLDRVPANSASDSAEAEAEAAEEND